MHNATRMECKSPKISVDLNEKINPENGLEIDYGFIMDNVKRVRNLKKRSDIGGFRLFPTPVYLKFEEENNVSYWKLVRKYLIIIINNNSLSII